MEPLITNNKYLYRSQSPHPGGSTVRAARYGAPFLPRAQHRMLCCDYCASLTVTSVVLLAERFNFSHNRIERAVRSPIMAGARFEGVTGQQRF